MNKPADQLTINSPVSVILNPRAYSTKKALERLGIRTLEDLVTFLPFRYEDHTNVSSVKELRPEIDSVIIGEITNVSWRKSKRGVLIIQAVINDGTAKIPAVWFNQRFLLRTLREKSEITLFGAKRLVPSMNNPFFVKKIIAKPEICPIYHSTAGLAQPTIRRLITEALRHLPPLPDLLPDDLRTTLKLPARDSALRECHQPTQPSAYSRAYELLGTEELIVLGLQAEMALAQRRSISREVLSVPVTELKELSQSLPFELTDSQRKAAWEIIQDLTKPYPMNRLLYGEVGSGKTIVALLVAATVVKNGRTVALLCPTVALAHQQAAVAERLLKSLSIEVDLVTSEKKTNTGAKLVIGTHALLRSTTLQPDLVIIDEQHRFGVKQRQELVAQAPQTHLLMMTATPIPRSLSQTMFRYLDITYLSVKPIHQKPVITQIFTNSERKKIEQTIQQSIQRGEPGYVICPRIDEAEVESDELFPNELTAVKKEVKRLAQEFPTARIAAIHGQTDKKILQTTLEEFRNGEIDILVATTIVEVGIDNPRATWMLIENGEQFGLSTLHQLRGRVGRGDKQSYCFIHDNSSSEAASERLKEFSAIQSGLELAEIDLRLRGPGELSGLNQSGAVLLRYATWDDQQAIQKVFDLSQKIIKDGINKYPQLKKKVDEEKLHIA